MSIVLTDTTSGQIDRALREAGWLADSPARGLVLTLVIDTDETRAEAALAAAEEASREHPARILVTIRKPGEAPARLDAEIRVGPETGTGETVLLRLGGGVAAHAASVVLPLLLPDVPAVVWWPAGAPRDVARDPLGGLGKRRITDAATDETPLERLAVRAAMYRPGDTDLAWTRITGWRSTLAAALDQARADVTGATVAGEGGNPSRELLAWWLADRLGVPVERVATAGPGITSVRLRTTSGEIVVDRPDGRMAALSIPGQPDRRIALARRGIADLIAEELRRLDQDDTYAAALGQGVRETVNATAGTAHPSESARQERQERVDA
jgi:glucose-6-phosphate dehydrogenase assembly protein OpcA